MKIARPSTPAQSKPMKNVDSSMRASSAKLQYIYALAKAYLADNAPISGDELKEYFNPKGTYKSKNEILYGLP